MKFYSLYFDSVLWKHTESVTFVVVISVASPEMCVHFRQGGASSSAKSVAKMQRYRNPPRPAVAYENVRTSNGSDPLADSCPLRLQGLQETMLIWNVLSLLLLEIHDIFVHIFVTGFLSLNFLPTMKFISSHRTTVKLCTRISRKQCNLRREFRCW